MDVVLRSEFYTSWLEGQDRQLARLGMCLKRKIKTSGPASELRTLNEPAELWKIKSNILPEIWKFILSLFSF